MLEKFGHIILVLLISFSFNQSAHAENEEIYVDSEGVMRFSSDNREASFYGVNYTLPFAHAYRAVGYAGKDRKECIDKDVYHISRLGVNAYRIHIWDVEISDQNGNVIDNEHLDLLDYLIYRLNEYNIYTLITLQTNFGNGYPERNIVTDGYSYLYDKANIHSHKDAREAQQNYVKGIVSHINRYKNIAYGEDPMIVGFEINNEPHHDKTPEVTLDYINGMVGAIRSTGTKKPLFYNASHNMGHQSAYFASDIQGVTYQWYPTGLVGGKTRKGNFLPAVDSYKIPFDTLPGYADKTKIVYEFDPADILYSYMFPAMARTFRSEGFQWITQFSYDPVDLAHVNTEYQTHYLNLVYTPAKAIGMKIAAEAAYSLPRNKKYPKYPNDTIFGDFTVSYHRDLSVMNSGEKFFYTGSNDIVPADNNKIREIAGCGSSQLVKYDGTGAYFLEKSGDKEWRLEVMPDVVYLDDPFKKASPDKQVAAINNCERKMEIYIPELGNNYTIIPISDEVSGRKVEVINRAFKVFPGIYMIQGEKGNMDDIVFPGKFALKQKNVITETNLPLCAVNHNTPTVAIKGKALELSLTAVASAGIDSIMVYPDDISFWRDDNKSISLNGVKPYEYAVNIPAEWIEKEKLRYNVVVYSGDQCYTYPGNVKGHPLDWDYINEYYYEVPVKEENSSIELISGNDPGIEYYSIPDRDYEGDKEFITKYYIRQKLESHKKQTVTTLKISGVNSDEKLQIALITSDGYTYGAECENYEPGVYGIRFTDLKSVPTLILPHAYPVFLDKTFEPEISIPFDFNKVEYVQIHTGAPYNENLSEVWIE